MLTTKGGGVAGPIALAVLRSHPYPATTLDFSPDGLTLVSGDEGGWCIWWSLLKRRPLAIWRPHAKSVITVKWTAEDQMLTHGRDNKLYIWKLDGALQTSLPDRNSSGDSYQNPWMVHSQDVNTLNFCGAAVCNQNNTLAVPSTLNSSRIDIYKVAAGQLSRPVNGLASSIGDDKAGILMALVLTLDIVIAGYESGHVVVFNLQDQQEIFCEKLHTQPVMSLRLHNGVVTSTSADSLIVQTHLDKLTHNAHNTKHAGLASVDVRSDGMIMATAGWDGMVRVFRLKDFKPLATFRGGRQQSVNCVAFAAIHDLSKAESPITLIEKKELAVRRAHYLAVAGKDGCIGLYEIY